MDYINRFSLLLLEPGEIYFCDYAAIYLPPKKNGEEKDGWEKTWCTESLKGRLKMCSKSIVFEPFTKKVPLIKFFLRNCSTIQEGNSDDSNLLLNQQDRIIEITSDLSIEMLENNLIKPYKFRRKTYKHCFHLTLMKAEEVLPRMLQLHRASTLPVYDQNVMIQAIVRSLLKRHCFDLSFLKDSSESVILEYQANKVNPLVSNPGRVLVSSSALYFQPFNNLEQPPVFRIAFDDIREVIKRRYLLRHVGLEIFCKKTKSNPIEHLYLLFKEPHERDRVYDCLFQEERLKLLIPSQSAITFKWEVGAISNFEYLSYLNSQADRSVNDLTQYPVFPWVIADYKSETLDLLNPSTYRDLTKPIGALNEERLAALKDRCKDMPEPKFLYGSHYSTPGFVVYYMLRQYPQYMLCLQNGKYDQPDRMFNSLLDTWYNVTTNPSDFKELIPEFYDTTKSGEFLANKKSISFGVRYNGELVWDVQLPPWAKSPQDFVVTLRRALEGPYVSSLLNNWIDLIFGYKQKGEEADKANNLFYPLCYEGAIDLAAITDLNERIAAEVQITEFGQIPKQLFTSCHPKKNPSLSFYGLHEDDSSKQHGLYLQENSAEQPLLWKLFSNLHNISKITSVQLHRKEITHLTFVPSNCALISLDKDGCLKALSFPSFEQIGNMDVSNLSVSCCVHLPGTSEVLISSWDNYLYRYHLKMYQKKDSLQAHSDAITCLDIGHQVIVTGSCDCLVRVWSFKSPVPETAGGWSNWRLYMDDLIIQVEHDSPVTNVSLHPVDEVYASATKEGCLLIWQLSKENLIFKKEVHKGAINAISWSLMGERLLTCGEDGMAYIHDYATKAKLICCSFNYPLRCSLWDGRLALLGDSKGTIIINDFGKEEVLHSIDAHSGAVTSLALSPDKNLFVSGGEDKQIILWGPSLEPL